MITRETTAAELAALLSEALQAADITAVLSGGAVVQIYSEGQYVSKDLDFVSSASNHEIEKILRKLGFERTDAGRLFAHPRNDYLVEFPRWPVAFGDQVAHEWDTLETDAGSIQILSPTQCVQDRLAAYFHWQDMQALEQALLVCRHQAVDLDTIRQWAESEGQLSAYRRFKEAL